MTSARAMTHLRFDSLESKGQPIFQRGMRMTCADLVLPRADTAIAAARAVAP